MIFLLTEGVHDDNYETSFAQHGNDFDLHNVKN